MKEFLFLCFCAFSINSSAQLADSTIRNLKQGKVKVDSSYIYWLPYEKGKKHLFIQGANSKFSHKDELSFDFKMPIGSKVCSAREGIIIATKSDSDKGGLKEEYLNDGNHIIIQHADGSEAYYWHLKQNAVFVIVGDTVKKGQIIGSSGNTGYSAFPHLHFQIIDITGKQILPRFKTKKTVIYIRPGHWYKCVNS